MTAKVQRPSSDFPNEDALVQAAATITAALIQRTPGKIDGPWITSAFAEAYVALLMAPPAVEVEYQEALKRLS